MTDHPTDPLLGLAWHGAFTPLQDRSAYYGRYASQDLFDGDAVRGLMGQGYAEAQSLAAVQAPIYPTRAGLEEAARRSPPALGEGDRIRAVLGSRDWEFEINGRAPLAGLFLTRDSVAELVEGLAGVLESKSAASVHLATIGGVVPAAVAVEIAGEELEGAPGLELALVPDEVASLVNLTRRYRFVLDVRPKSAAVVVFQWAGPNPRLLATVTLAGLVASFEGAHPKLAGEASFARLEELVSAFEGEPKLEVLL